MLLLDIFFTLFHLALTLFNVFGWVARGTRSVHRWCVFLTAACWVTIGPIFYRTLGYCPLTDWHWRLKEMRGETNLPSSFITYMLNLIGLYPAPDLVQTGTGVIFGAVILITIFLAWRDAKSAHIAPQTSFHHILDKIKKNR